MTPLSHPPLWVRASRAVVRRLPAARYRAMNAVVGAARRLGWGRQSFWTRTARFAFLCDLGDSIGREVCYTGSYEAAESALLQALLPPGGTFVDVGANWGYFSLLAATLLGPKGRIVSFEPDPRLFALLVANLHENGARCATALQIAASAQAGTLTLAGFEERNGNWGLSRLTERATPGATTFQVRTQAVDAALTEQDIGIVDLLKMDIEGAEDQALHGMQAGLAAGRYRRLLLELHPTLLAEKGVTPEEAIRPLQAAGYQGWRIDHSPAAMRRAAYGRAVRLDEFLRPAHDLRDLDAWPHLLWSAPGQELPAHA